MTYYRNCDYGLVYRLSLFLSVLEICAPAFIIAGIGFFWKKFGYEYRIEFVTKLVMSLTIPCLIFSALIQTQIDFEILKTLFYATLAVLAMIVAAAYLVVVILGLNRQTFLAPMIFGNSANIGIPICLLAFGQTGFELAIFVFSIMAIFSMTFGVWLITDREPPVRLIKEPLVIAVLLGTLFLFNGWKLPVFFTNTLQLVGETSIPLMLLTLGVTIAKLQITAISKLLWPSILKFSVCLFCGALGIYFFKLDDLAAAALLLQVTMPVAVSSYMLAEKYSSEAQEVAAFVVVSTLLALIYIPLTLAFLLR